MLYIVKRIEKLPLKCLSNSYDLPLLLPLPLALPLALALPLPLALPLALALALPLPLPLPPPLPIPLRSFKPKYRTVSQVLLQLVVASSWRISSSHRGMNLTGFMPSPAFRMPSHY